MLRSERRSTPLSHPRSGESRRRNRLDARRREDFTRAVRQTANSAGASECAPMGVRASMLS